MLLDTWLLEQNVSLKQFEHLVLNPNTGKPYSYTTLFRIAHHQPCDSYVAAKTISLATQGQVSIPEIADAEVIGQVLRERAQRDAQKSAPAEDAPPRRKKAKPEQQPAQAAATLVSGERVQLRRKRASKRRGSPSAVTAAA